MKTLEPSGTTTVTSANELIPPSFPITGVITDNFYFKVKVINS